MKMYQMGIMPTYPMNQVMADFIMNPTPPTLYSIMNSIANYGKEEETKIRNLASATHDKIFDFEYPLSSKVDRDDFECQILNHFIMRRIGQETFTAFQLFLENKLNEILPYYNIMFDSLVDYNLFNDGEVITRNRTDNGASSKNSENNGTSSLSGTNQVKNKFSEYPLGQLTDIDDDTYVSTQNNSNGTTSNSGTTSNTLSETGTTNNTTIETETRSGLDKMDLYMKYLQTKNSIMTMIYKDLDILFYGLVD